MLLCENASKKSFSSEQMKKQNVAMYVPKRAYTLHKMHTKVSQQHGIAIKQKTAYRKKNIPIIFVSQTSTQA